MTHRSTWTDFFGVPFTQRWTNAGGVSTRILETGKAGAPALILLHGTGGHAEAYGRNLGAHGKHFHTYAYDMVGHGFSDKPAQSYEIADYVEHLRALMDAEGLKEAHISGESLGGWVAARFALAYPERVTSLVLNTTGGSTFDLEVMARIKTLSLAAVEQATWETVKRRLEFLMKDPASVTDDLVATRLWIYTRPGFVDTMRRILCLQEPDVRRRNMLAPDDWRAIAARTLVLWTTHDPTAPPSIGREIAKLVPNARFELMEDCGHWPQFEDTETFNRIHLSFLRGSA
jgi:2-hydroxy-6-oxonona-2,4-dienedioate hydrolase